MTLVLVCPNGNYYSSSKIKTKCDLHKMKNCFHPTKMISKPRKLYSKYKLPPAPHNTTQYLLSNYEADPKHFQMLYAEFNSGSMMGMMNGSRLAESQDEGEAFEMNANFPNGLKWIEDEMKMVKMSKDKNMMNSIITKFGEVLREQQTRINELERMLQLTEEKKIQFA